MRTVLAALMLLIGSVSNGAEVFLWDPLAPIDLGVGQNDDSPREDWLPGRINIIGPIEEGDLEKIIVALKRQEYMPGFAISSSGGDVLEAMEIGRFFRDSRLDITVKDNARCVGPCFLIVVGATGRYLQSPVGFHRAYTDPERDKSRSSAQAKKTDEELDSLVSAYLEEMYVPEDVIAELMSTQPAAESYLSPAEFRRRLGQHPPTTAEWKVASCGEMTDDEKLLYRGVVALRNYEKHYEGKDPALFNAEEKAWLRYSAEDIKLGLSLSDMVKERLHNKHQRVNNCVLPIEKEHDRKLLQAMKDLE
ncbi:MAG: hypothetical protein P8X94_01445 [Woeseiaceae bacterium]